MGCIRDLVHQLFTLDAQGNDQSLQRSYVSLHMQIVVKIAIQTSHIHSTCVHSGLAYVSDVAQHVRNWVAYEARALLC